MNGRSRSAAAGDALAAAMAAVWEQSRGLMEGWVSTIEDAVVGLLAGDADLEARREAERQAHKLAGSMGTFGRQRGSDLAREIERLLQGSQTLRPEVTLRLSELVVDLGAELGKESSAPPAGPPARADGPEVLVVDPDVDFAHRVVEQAFASGLRAKAVDSAGAALCEVARHPALVLVDPAICGPSGNGLDLVAELSAAAPTTPVIVLADRSAGIDRVTVSRAGGSSLLEKPLSPRDVVASATRVLDRLRSDATLLVVDDDPTVAAFLRELLGAHGMHVEGLVDPRELWLALDEIRPDLLVLDLDIPNIDGLELCRMIRRDPAWLDLPIVFLTGTADTDWIAEMFAAGADDHLAKPIVADDVVMRIGNRLRRSRALRSHGLEPATALDAPPAFVREVERLLALARRRDRPFALAVVQVDNVDALTEAGGSSSVDAAVGAVGRLLSRAARPEDVVGSVDDRRHGIAMYEHDVSAAVERLATFLHTVRDQEIVVTGGRRLRVTASAGVAGFPRDGEGANALLAAAGQALARAQDGGGDCVVSTEVRPGEGPGVVEVLLVDDDEAMGALLLHALATRGYRTEWVRDGAEAASLLVDQRALGARVVLLDVGLPGLDGLAVLRKLADNGVLSSTRVIMVTLRASDADVLEALDLGAFDHVAKPFSLPVLLHRIRRALDSLPA